MKNGTDCLIIGQVFKKLHLIVSDMSVWICCFRNRLGLVIIIAHVAYHTHVKAFYGLTRKPVLPRVHIPTEKKPCFVTEQNEFVVYFSSMYPMKAAVHKIQSCFTINCVNHSCLVWCKCSSFVALCVNDADMSLFSACQTMDFYWWCLQTSTILSVYSCTHCMICYFLEYSLLLKIFSHIIRFVIPVVSL